MNSSVPSEPSLSLSSSPQGVAEEGAKEWLNTDTELARYLPHLSRMSAQLKQTSTQIESSVVGVCNSFQGIAERARSTVSRTTGFLSSKGKGASSRQSFEDLIQNCSDTLVKILNTTEEAGEVSRRAIDRINQMDKASQLIGAALVKLEQIAHENKMLAMNARIEAAHISTRLVNRHYLDATLAPEGAEKSENPWHVKEYRPGEFRQLCQAVRCDSLLQG